MDLRDSARAITRLRVRIESAGEDWGEVERRAIKRHRESTVDLVTAFEIEAYDCLHPVEKE